MIPKSPRQTRWLSYGVWSISIFGCISILSVPAFFRGLVPVWFPILALMLGAGAYFVCLRQVRRP